MATKVWKVDNQLRIETGGTTTYGNAALYSILEFTATSVTLIYTGVTNISTLTIINFTDFQDDAAVPYATEAAIADYLAPLLG
jgi:hypothetical protein